MKNSVETEQITLEVKVIDFDTFESIPICEKSKDICRLLDVNTMSNELILSLNDLGMNIITINAREHFHVMGLRHKAKEYVKSLLIKL